MEITPEVLSEENGQTRTPADPSAAQEEENSSTMGDPALPSSEPFVNDDDNSKPDGAAAPTPPVEMRPEVERERAFSEGRVEGSTDEEHENEDVDEGDKKAGEGGDVKNQEKGNSGFERPTKVILRRLPPRISQQEFIDSVGPLPEYDYLQVDNPDYGWGANARSTAHINFLSPDDALWFIERFTGYEFLDEEGESFIGLGDYAMSQKIFRSKVKNNDRGKLLESEDWIEFLQKYEENPFAFKVGIPPRDIPTAEEMLEEIEARPKRGGPESTPLTEYLLRIRRRKDEERRLKKEKEKDRKLLLEKVNRDKEKERKDGVREREPNRDPRRERRREKREKERKEKRERDKLEKEAKTKGQTVTVSKSGQVTRWSANSGPAYKKGKDAEAKVEKDSEAKDKTTPPVEATDKENKSAPTDSNPPEIKKKVNPFSKEAKPRPKEDKPKPKFGKPFPTKTDSSSSKSQSAATTDETCTKDTKPAKESGSLSKTEAEPKATSDEGEAKGKKKVIKKIIRVNKVKKNGEEVEGGSAVETKVIIKKAVGSEKKNTDKADKAEKPSLSSTSSSQAKEHPDASSSSSSAPAKATATKASPTNVKPDDKRKRTRPDMQIYRPGSLRSKEASKPKEEKKQEEVPPPSSS